MDNKSIKNKTSSKAEKEIIQDRKKEEEIIKTLLNLSEKLSEIKDHDKKIQLLTEFDSFLKENKEIIKMKCPDLLVSVLNSL